MIFFIINKGNLHELSGERPETRTTNRTFAWTAAERFWSRTLLRFDFT